MRNTSNIAVVISPDRRLHQQIEAALTATAVADAAWSVPDYPELRELERLREAGNGCVLFLDFTDPVRARRIAAELDRAFPGVSVIAIHSVDAKHDLLQMMQLGIREVLSPPLERHQIVSTFVRALRKLHGGDATIQNIYAFLPAKPGTGATTIAINVAWAIARSIDPEHVLLLDFDLRLGITSFLMKLDGRHSVQDALMASARLDEAVWENLVCRRDNLHVLGSAPVDIPDFPEDACRAVLDCAHGLYRVVCVDLAGAMELHELATLQRAKEVFLVTTADIAGLHMAKRKSESLQKLGIAENVSVIMNRAERRSSLPIADIERILNFPVRFTVPSDDKAVTKSVHNGLPVESGSPIGAQITAIAKSIVGTMIPGGATPAKRRFVDYFSISPVRDRITWKR